MIVILRKHYVNRKYKLRRVSMCMIPISDSNSIHVHLYDLILFPNLAMETCL